MANRKRHAVDGAASDRWALLGHRLAAWRTIHLGCDTQTGFARERLPPTPQGNPNIRLVADIENNRRPGTYPQQKLELIAHSYGVTYKSVLAVLDGTADELTAAAPVPAEDWHPPAAEPGRADEVWPYFRPIADRLLSFARAGQPDPSGAQMFATEPDAETWDSDVARKLDPLDRAWLIAAMRRNAARRSTDRRTNGATQAG